MLEADRQNHDETPGTDSAGANMPTPTTRTPEVSENDVLRAMFAARKEVFVDLLKWDLPVLDGRFEIDQFDTPAAHYLILADEWGRHRASARLLPTDSSHQIGRAHVCTPVTHAQLVCRL